MIDFTGAVISARLGHRNRIFLRGEISHGQNAQLCSSRRTHVPKTSRFPDVELTDALIRITTTTICGTDVHISSRANIPGRKEAYDRSRARGRHRETCLAVTGYAEGQRVVAGAITPTGATPACADATRRTGAQAFQALGGWRLQHDRWLPGPIAFSFRMRWPILSPVPDNLSDEQVLIARHHVDRLWPRAGA